MIRSLARKTVTPTGRVEAMLAEYASIQVKTEELKLKMDSLFISIDQTMTENGLDLIDSSGWNAAIVDIKTNTKNVTDPKRLYDLLEINDDLESFWKSVAVSATKVKKYITGKEYALITDTIPSKITGKKLKVIPTKKTVISK